MMDHVVIDWRNPIISGGLFERIVGCLLGLKNPTAIRITPDQGDGGVDIYALTDDGCEVFQCKHYPHRIHWQHVRASLERLRGGEAFNRPVTRWNLVVPQQPTPRKFRTFEDVTGDLPFEAHWRGTDYLDGLTSQHPCVADYYLGDGEAKLRRLARDWANAFSRLAEGEAPGLEDIEERLTELADALGRNDPHIAFGIASHPFRPEPDARPRALQRVVRQSGGRWIEAYAAPRYRGAAEDAGERLSMTLTVQGLGVGKLKYLAEYGGGPVELSADEIVTLTLPNLLVEGGVMDGPQGLVLSPIANTEPATLWLTVLQGNEQTNVPLRRVSTTRGVKGSVSSWCSPAGTFEVQIEAEPAAGRIAMRVTSLKQLEGAVRDLAGDLPWLRAARAGARLALVLPHSPVPSERDLPTLEADLLDQDFVKLLEALLAIQRHTNSVVVVPERVSSEQLDTIEFYASLLDGHVVVDDITNCALEIRLVRDANILSALDQVEEEWTLAIGGSLDPSLELPHQTIDLVDEYPVTHRFRSLRVADLIDQSEVGELSVRLVPNRSVDSLVARRDAPTNLRELSPEQLNSLMADLSGKL